MPRQEHIASQSGDSYRPGNEYWPSAKKPSPDSVQPSEWARTTASEMQAFKIGKDDEVTLFSPYYKGGEVTIPFHNLSEGGLIYRALRELGITRGGKQ